MKNFVFTAVMPKIDMTSIPQKIVHVNCGKPIDLNIPIRGRPQPVCSWYFGGVKLKDTLDRIKIDSTSKYIHLVIRETTISDTGDYTLEVKNTIGMATEVIKVIILGKQTFFTKLNVLYFQFLFSKVYFSFREKSKDKEIKKTKTVFLNSCLVVSVQTNRVFLWVQ